jgi:hypothetical protein
MRKEQIERAERKNRTQEKEMQEHEECEKIAEMGHARNHDTGTIGKGQLNSMIRMNRAQE